ncbi:hypothetical protein, partial [Bacteroides heparinolyticus]|uniref:hypothetical protein n=1 Tax=Prevotella heparinolytica TaxID=28113 RepID=UPI0035A13701
MVSFPFHFNSCAWCSVPPHPGRTSNHSVSWCYRCGGYAAPYTPFRHFPLPDCLHIENVFVPLPAGKRCVQVIAHYNPCRVVGSP